MIEVQDVSKWYGPTLAVDHLSFEVQPGIVTGFLGPNGAGKTTTMRMILGLDRPNSGSIRVNGGRFADLPAPPHEVGALLDAGAIAGGRTARQHLKWVARAGGIPNRRVDEVLELVGLHEVAGRKVGGFSLGMSQRLGIATALLGDPRVLIFDEPVNGLDPEGIRWVRELFKRLADEGRTLFVSSHLMSEMEATADHVLVIGRGRLIADASIEQITQASKSTHVRVVTPHAADFIPLLEQAGGTVSGDDGALSIVGLDAPRIGELAADHRVVLHELSPQRASLEAAFMELTLGSVEFQSTEQAEHVAETARAIAGEGAGEGTRPS